MGTENNDAACPECKKQQCEPLTDEDREKIIKAAQRWAEAKTPYDAVLPADGGHAGSGADISKGADCAGSVWAIYGEAGFCYTYVSSRDIKSSVSFEKIEEKDVKKGDVVQWDHVVVLKENPETGKKRDVGPAGHASIYDNGSGDDMMVYSAHTVGKPFDHCYADSFDSGRERNFFRFCKNKKGKCK